MNCDADSVVTQGLVFLLREPEPGLQPHHELQWPPFAVPLTTSLPPLPLWTASLSSFCLVSIVINIQINYLDSELFFFLKCLVLQKKIKKTATAEM